MKLILVRFIGVTGLTLLPLTLWAQMSISTQNTEGLFLCNAGLMHPPKSSRPNCYEPVAGSLCDPDLTAGSCICRKDAYQGDFISATIFRGDESFQKEVTAGGSSYSYLVNPDVAFNSEVRNLEFNLGSELYGSKYFIQFCYKGPLESLSQVASNGSTLDSSRGIYKVKLALLGLNKVYNGKLKSSATFTYECDLRNLGFNGNPRKVFENNPGALVEADVVNEDYVDISSNISGIGRHVTFGINQNETQVPRFCLFTVSFAESSDAARTSPTQAHFSGGLSVSK